MKKGKENIYWSSYTHTETNKKQYSMKMNKKMIYYSLYENQIKIYRWKKYIESKNVLKYIKINSFFFHWIKWNAFDYFKIWDI